MKRFIGKENKNILQWIGIAFLIWRAILFLIAFVGIKLFPLREGYLGGGTELYLKNPLLWSWANFDGVHYLTIAKHGYYQFQQAFFPFYPYFIRYLTNFTKNYFLSGFLISHLSFIISLFFLYKLVKFDFAETVAKRSLLYLFLFPTAFYFGSLYTESLFLLLILGSFYAARKKQWLLAGILGGFASATRFVGIFLFPAFLVEWWSQTPIRQPADKRQALNKLKSVSPLFLIILGLFFYMWYLQKTVGDPLYFLHTLSIFGPQRTGGKIILLYQVFWRYLKMILTTKADVLYFTVWFELLISLLFLAFTIFSYFRFRLSYFVFMLSACITPTLTGSFSSMPRYVLVLFPGFILLSVLAEKYRWLRILYPVFAIILGIVSVVLFTRGYWVA